MLDLHFLKIYLFNSIQSWNQSIFKIISFFQRLFQKPASKVAGALNAILEFALFGFQNIDTVALLQFQSRLHGRLRRVQTTTNHDIQFIAIQTEVNIEGFNSICVFQN